MRRIDFSYPELLSNIVKRLLLLIGKFAGYKGAAVLIATLEQILDETVSKALDTQYMELNEKFRKESEKLLKSRSFWRKTAVTELFIIAGTFFSVGALYKLQN